MNSSLPLVSVIMPVYNHQRFVQSALESVYQQTYPNLELIVVDDGSEDTSVAIIENCLQYSPISYRFIQQENRGAHAAINSGIDHAGGQYIAIINSDDIYHQDRIAQIIQKLNGGSHRFAFSKVQHINVEGYPLADDAPHRMYYLKSMVDLKCFPTPTFELIRHNVAVSTGNFVMDRNLYEEVGPFQPYQTCHDWDYLLRVILLEEPLFVEEELYQYRIHNQNTLQHLAQVRAKETDDVLSNYLENMHQALNPFVPAPDPWGAYWMLFVNLFMRHLERDSRAWSLLQPSSDEKAQALNDTQLWLIGKINCAINRTLNYWGKVRSWSTQEELKRKQNIINGFGRLLTGLFPYM
jgi:glycosyltransferase involved in cell wall biosynthesis